jgi:hypothetical protein
VREAGRLPRRDEILRDFLLAALRARAPAEAAIIG